MQVNGQFSAQFFAQQITARAEYPSAWLSFFARSTLSAVKWASFVGYGIKILGYLCILGRTGEGRNHAANQTAY